MLSRSTFKETFGGEITSQTVEVPEAWTEDMIAKSSNMWKVKYEESEVGASSYILGHHKFLMLQIRHDNR